MLYRKIDDNGLFVEDVILDSVPLLEDGALNPQYVETPCPGGFYWPKWNGVEWVESGSAPSHTPVEPTIEERVAATEQALLELVLGGALNG